MKVNNEHKNNELDEFFKEGFSDFQVPPPSGLRKLDHDPVDEAFKNELTGMESTPSPEVWNKVKTRIPLNLQVKRQLTWWTKIAAALILGLAFTVGLKEFQRHKADNLVSEPAQKEVVPLIPIESDFVYELQKGDKSDNKKAEKGTTARELLNEDFEVLEDRVSDIAPVAPLETISESVVSATDNPLDEKQRSSDKLGEIPLRTQNTADIESLSLKDEKVKDKVKKEAQENR